MKIFHSITLFLREVHIAQDTPVLPSNAEVLIQFCCIMFVVQRLIVLILKHYSPRFSIKSLETPRKSLRPYLERGSLTFFVNRQFSRHRYNYLCRNHLWSSTTMHSNNQNDLKAYNL